MLCIGRTGHGTATCHPTSTWTPSSTSSCHVSCKKAAKDVSSSPASTQTSVPCKHTSGCENVHKIFACSIPVLLNSFSPTQTVIVTLFHVSFSQGASKAEQVPHPLPYSGNFREVSWTHGHPLPDNADRHKFRAEWEYSGERLSSTFRNVEWKASFRQTNTVNTVLLWKDVWCVFEWVTPSLNKHCCGAEIARQRNAASAPHVVSLRAKISWHDLTTSLLELNSNSEQIGDHFYSGMSLDRIKQDMFFFLPAGDQRSRRGAAEEPGLHRGRPVQRPGGVQLGRRQQRPRDQEEAEGAGHRWAHLW